MIGMVMTLLADRRACIDLGDRHGKYFQIARGAPQGDRASPYIFIICIEILILKLETESSDCIRGGTIFGQENVPSHLKNSIIEAFADDLTLMFRWSLNALRRIITIMESFGDISGLCINMGKTSLMITGKAWEGDETVHGIKIVSECKLLGIKIDHKVEKLDQNWKESLRKVWGLIHYWKQFNLSVTGRVMVGKTFLMSQTTFLMSTIPAHKKTLVEIEEAIAQYVCGEMRIAKDRIHNRAEQGGLGLIPLEELDMAIKCAWVNRWIKEGQKVDYVGFRVLQAGEMDIERINSKNIERNAFPSSFSVAFAWERFRKKFL
jgi:hypothetical protein